MRRICVVISSRANYSSLKSVLEQISLSKKLTLQLVVGASALIESTQAADQISEVITDKINKTIEKLKTIPSVLRLVSKHIDKKKLFRKEVIINQINGSKKTIEIKFIII